MQKRRIFEYNTLYKVYIQYSPCAYMPLCTPICPCLPVFTQLYFFFLHFIVNYFTLIQSIFAIYTGTFLSVEKGCFGGIVPAQKKAPVWMPCVVWNEGNKRTAVQIPVVEICPLI